MNSSARELAEKLAWETDTRSSIEIHVGMKMVYNRLPESMSNMDFNTVDQTYIETASGQRFSDQRTSLDGKLFSRHTDYCDGKRSGRLVYNRDDLPSQELFTIKRFFGKEEQSRKIDRPRPLDLLSIGRKPLAQALVESAIPLGEGRIIDRPCDLFLFERVPSAVPQDHVYYLDRETGVPLHVMSFLDRPARERNEPVWTWTAESLDEVDGHHIPFKSTMVAPLRGPQKGITITHHFTVSSVQFDQKYPPSMFWPTYQPGLGVVDTISNKTMIVPGKAPEPQAKVTMAVGEPIRATPASDGSRVASVVALALGVSLLAAGLFAYFRRSP